MRISVIANQKGGIGKSTTALQLSAGLMAKKYSVLTVDADPQGNLSHTMRADPNAEGIFEALNGEQIEGLIQKTEQGRYIGKLSTTYRSR